MSSCRKMTDGIHTPKVQNVTEVFTDFVEKVSDSGENQRLASAVTRSQRV